MQSLGAKARKLWSELVRIGEHCEICGRVGEPDAQGRMIVGLHAHHLVPSTRLQFKYVLENGLCLCSPCHQLWHVNADDKRQLLDMLRIINPDKWAFYQQNIGASSQAIESDRTALEKLKLLKPEVLEAARFENCF